MTGSTGRGGLFSSLRGLATTGLALLQTRLELLAVELQEEKERVLSLALYGVAGAILMSAGVVFLAIFLTVAFWETNRLAVLGVVTVLLLGGGGVCLWLARRQARSGSRLFVGSLAEIAADRQALAGAREPPAS